MRHTAWTAASALLVGSIAMTPAARIDAAALLHPAHATSEQGSLPDGPGKDVVERTCTSCHGVDYMTTGERTIPDWRDTLDVMKSYGATASDEDWKTVTDYVVASLATVAVNKSTAPEIALVLAMPAAAAENVVAYRDKQGGFKSIDDLKTAPDVDVARVEAVKTRLKFE
jgi:competence protein ComEA